MKTLTYLLVFVLLTIGSQAQNLIPNSSFENNMEPNCSGWYTACGDPLDSVCNWGWYCEVGFFEESPSVVPEEKWSLQMRANMWGGYVYTYVTGLSGSRLLELSGYIKSPEWNSVIELAQVRDGIPTSILSDTVNSETWVESKALATLFLEPEDTLMVSFGVGLGDFCQCTGYFDFIQLRDLGEASALSNYTLGQGIRLQNNPTYDWVIVKGVEPTEVEKLVVQNSMGQEIVNLAYADSFHTLTMLPGYYLVHLKLTDGNLVTRQFVKR